MTRDGITVKQISPHVGAEIGNVDLTRTLTNHEVDQIHDAIIAHGVIFFREQNITPADHERFIRYFGEPHVHVGGKNTASQAVPGFPAHSTIDELVQSDVRDVLPQRFYLLETTR